MGLETLKVVLEPRQPVYFPGQTLRGFVIVVADTAVYCREVRVNCKGNAFALWTKRSGKSFRNFVSREEYVNESDIVWWGAERNNIIGPGDYPLPFSFILPNELPSSVETRHGYVRYLVEAVMLGAGASSRRSAEVLFSVSSVVDLNATPLARKTVHMEKDQTPFCLCCGGGSIHLSLKAPRTGYVPGEDIVVYGEVINHSRSSIKYSEIKLVQIFKYFAKKETKMQIRTIDRKGRPEIRSGGCEVWSRVSLHIPPVPPSCLQWCKIMNIDYFLVLRIKMGLYRGAQLTIPILIGTVPLRGTIVVDTEGRRDHQCSPPIISHSSPPPDTPVAREVSLGAPSPYSYLTKLPHEYTDLPAPSYGSWSIDDKQYLSSSPTSPTHSIHSPTYSPTHSTHSPTHSTHSPTHSTHSLTHSTHSPTHSLTYSTHNLTHHTHTHMSVRFTPHYVTYSAADST